MPGGPPGGGAPSQDLIQETPGLCGPLCVRPTLKLVVAFHLNVQVLVVLSSMALKSDTFSLKAKETGARDFFR